MKKSPLFFLFVFIVFVKGLMAQNTINGTITSGISQPVEGARVIFFNADTSFFAETRSNLAGNYSFNNIPNGNYTLGVAKEGMDYVDTVLSITSNLSNFNFLVQTETHAGEWNVVLNSPQPLGGTDLGILLPDGKIFYCHDTEDPFLFNPATDQVSTPTGYDTTQGCVGPLLLPDGKVIFMGGTNTQVYGPGTKKVKTYNPVADTWQLMPNLLDYRWYPTVTSLSDGRILITGGGGLQNPWRINTTELYDPTTGQSMWADTIAIGNEVSPVVQLYTGKVLMTHRPPQLFAPSTNQWNLAADFVQGNRMPNGDHSDHELVLLPNDDGRAIAIGHISFVPNQLGNLVEIYDPQIDSWRLGSNYTPLRSRSKLVLLPNRKIIVIGGYKEDQAHPAPVNQWGQLFLTDEYDPATDIWRRLENIHTAREYHATAILVPDGRVITVGGEGKPGREPSESIIEAFSPPYLFRGVRPEIHSVTGDFKPGGSLLLTVSRADSVTAVRLVSTASVTHFMNSGNNRFLELSFSQNANTLNVQLPVDSVTLPDGFYMLFVMVDDVPSIAKMVKVESQNPLVFNKAFPHFKSLNTYPNPVRDVLHIEIPEMTDSKAILKVMDFGGKLLMRREISFQDKSYIVDITGTPAGIYFVVLSSGSERWVSKVVVVD